MCSALLARVLAPFRLLSPDPRACCACRCVAWQGAREWDAAAAALVDDTLLDKLPPLISPTEAAGTLLPDVAEALGLTPGTPPPWQNRATPRHIVARRAVTPPMPAERFAA
eukprot:6971044-Prymnesium_polylepis.2